MLIFPSFTLSLTSFFYERLNAKSLHVPLKIENLKELQIPNSDNNFSTHKKSLLDEQNVHPICLPSLDDRDSFLPLRSMYLPQKFVSVFILNLFNSLLIILLLGTPATKNTNCFISSRHFIAWEIYSQHLHLVMLVD